MQKSAFQRFIDGAAWPLAASLVAFYVFIVASYLRTLSMGSPYEPGQGMTESIRQPILHRGEWLQLEVSTSVDQGGCVVYVQRAIVRENGEIVFQKVYPISSTHLENMINSKTIFSIQLPAFAPSKYYYKADVYLNCPGGRSFVRNTGLIPFEVVD